MTRLFFLPVVLACGLLVAGLILAARARRTPPVPSEDGRAWWLAMLGAVGLAVWSGDGTGNPLAFGWLLLGVACLSLASGVLHGRVTEDLAWPLASALFVTCCVVSTLRPPGNHLVPYSQIQHLTWVAVRVLAGLFAIGAWFAPPRISRYMLPLAAVAVGWAILWTLWRSPNPPIDVTHFFRASAGFLAEGRNPYAMQMPNIYGPLTPFWAPEVIDADRIRVGFPYPAVALLFGSLGEWLFGDYRRLFGALFMVSVTAFGLARKGNLRPALGLLMFPRIEYLFEQGWSDGLSVGLLMAAAAAMRSGAIGGLLAGLWIASKPYFLPFLWLVRKPNRLPSVAAWTILATVGFFYLLPLPFAPGPYLWSTWGIQFYQPMRQDSLSLLFAPWWVMVSGTMLWLAGGWAYWRRRPALLGDPSLVQVGMLVWLFAGFLLFNKQAFANYYFSLSSLCAIRASLASTQAPS